MDDELKLMRWPFPPAEAKAVEPVRAPARAARARTAVGPSRQRRPATTRVTIGAMPKNVWMAVSREAREQGVAPSHIVITALRKHLRLG